MVVQFTVFLSLKALAACTIDAIQQRKEATQMVHWLSRISTKRQDTWVWGHGRWHLDHFSISFPAVLAMVSMRLALEFQLSWHHIF